MNVASKFVEIIDNEVLKSLRNVIRLIKLGVKITLVGVSLGGLSYFLYCTSSGQTFFRKLLLYRNVFTGKIVFVNRWLANLTRRQWEGAYLNFGHDPLILQKRSCDNGHAACGGLRDSCRRHITEHITSQGYSIFEINGSGHNQTESTDRRIMHITTTGDRWAGNTMDAVTDEDCIVLIDTDYYVHDMNQILAFGNPVVAFTFSPMHVSGEDLDCGFTIQNNRVSYNVGGGGNWDHPVWDWNAYGEFTSVRLRRSNPTFTEVLLGILGIHRYVHHKIIWTRPCKEAPHRIIAWAIPQFTVMQCSWTISELRGRQLRHVNYSVDSRPKWNALEFISQGNGKRHISIGRAGHTAHIEIPKEEYDVLIGAPSVQAATTTMVALEYPVLTRRLMNQFYLNNDIAIDNLYSIGRPYQSVQWPVATLAEQPEVNMRSISEPIINVSASSPMLKRFDSLSVSIDRRVTFVVNNSEPSKHIQVYAGEFVNYLVPEPGIGVPLDIDETIQRLDKPSQVHAMNRVWDTIGEKHRSLIEGFLKNEPSHKPGRIISSFADIKYIIGLSSFTLAFREEILDDECNKHWFIPGDTPTEIAFKVREYMGTVRDPIEGDYSNFDGTVSSWLQRNVVNAAYLRWCHPTYRRELNDFLSDLVSSPARAKRFGFRYDSGPGIKSGSPTTCDGNTMLNAFLQYCAIRDNLRSACSVREAMQLVGMCFGDDSIFEGQFRNSWNRIVKKVGMTIKIENYVPENGITFLCRVFPEPLTSCHSFQDPLRTLMKLHLTARNQMVPICDAAWDRVEGYLTTDSLTPVISDYCHAIQRCYEETDRRLGRSDRSLDQPYWSHENNSWPQEEEMEEATCNVFASRLGVSVEKLLELASQLRAVNSLADMPQLHITEESPAIDNVDSNGVDTPLAAFNFDKNRNAFNRRADPPLSKADTGPSANTSRRRTGAQTGARYRRFKPMSRKV